MLSQLLYRRRAWTEAADAAAKGIKLLYEWGTHWDKQVTYAQWVGFARMCHLRAKRREAGVKALPSQANTPAKRPGANEVTYLQDVMKAFETYTVPLRSAPPKSGVLTHKTKLVGALVHGNKSKL